MFLRYQEQHSNGLRRMMRAAVTSVATLDPLPSSLSAASAALVRDSSSSAHSVRARFLLACALVGSAACTHVFCVREK